MGVEDRWRGRVALVTGATSGIGQATARRLSEMGLLVCLTGRRRDRLEALKSTLDNASVYELDVSDEDSVVSVFDQVARDHGGLDVLVNNAGLGYRESLLEGDTARWREMLEVNVLGLCLCTREGARLMKGRSEGHIFHLGSLSGHRVPPGSNVYGATKFAVRSLTESLRQELVERKLPIRVTSVSPGFVETEFHERYFGSNEESRSLYERQRVLDSGDIADAIAYALKTPPHVALHDLLIRSSAQPT